MDLDGDGNLDLLSGSWPGELFFFKGGPGRTFAKPEKLRLANGEFINIGGGIREQPNGEILITGDGEFKNEDGHSYIVYNGKRIENSDDHPIAMTGTASAVFAADWDGDSDLDLIVGNIRGEVWLIPNERAASGGATEPWKFGTPVQLEARGDSLAALGATIQRHSAIRVGGDAGPCVVDWDGDGDLDLLVGDGEGKVSLFRNVGTRTKPELAAAEILIPAGKTTYGAGAPRTPVRGCRSKVCVADWNGDGLLDLLVGDIATMKPDLPDPTPEERKRIDELRAKQDELQKQYGRLVNELYSGPRKLSADERKELQEKLSKLQEEMEPLRKEIPPEYEDHGWVWLFAQKAPLKSAKAN